MREIKKLSITIVVKRKKRMILGGREGQERC